MANKYSNNIDFNKIKTIATKNKKVIHDLINSNDLMRDLLNKFNIDNKVKCYIFAKSITFRIGKTSITINGKKAKSSGELSKAKLSSNNAFNRIYLVMLACYLIDPKRILESEDKTENAENAQLSELKKIFSEIRKTDVEDYIIINVGKEQIKVDDIFQTKGRPKSDIYFSYLGKAVIHISLKKGNKAADFQQYGGFSNDLGFKGRFSNIVSGNDYKEIIKFLDDVDTVLRYKGAKIEKDGIDVSSLPKGNNYARILTSTKASNICLFGKDFGKSLGINNVHLLLDGDINLTAKKDGTYDISATYHTHVNPNIAGGSNAPSSGDYAPVMFIMRSEKQHLNQAGFVNARAVVWPNNNIAKGYAKSFEKDLVEAKKNGF